MYRRVEMRRTVPLVLALCVVVPGCSLTGLDRFDWPDCDECEVLNERDRIGDDDCERWQCDLQTDECRFGPLDQDGDQHGPLRCGGDDCDDTAASAYAGASEICNGIDDDCNGWIDDASIDAAAPVAVLDAPSAPRWVSSASVEGGLIAAYQTSGGAGVEVIDDASPITAGEPLVLATTAPPYETSNADVVDGCANDVQSAQPLQRCGEGDACPTGQECVTSRAGDRLCDEPLTGGTEPGECTHDAECDDGVFCNGHESCEPMSPASDSFGCRAPERDTPCTTGETCIESGRLCTRVSPAASACGIADAAIASTGDGEWIAAAITDSGCATGALRLGYFVESPGRAPESRYPVRRVVQRGDAAATRSTSWLGIDVSAAERCPGPATGRAEGAPLGASGPSIAALPADRDAGRLRAQGLVVYLAGPLCRGLGTCSSDPSRRPAGADGSLDVELVGVWLEEGSAGGAQVGWVNASGSGEPVRLGVSSGAGATRASVSAWTSGARAGYVMTYPLASGGVALHVVPAMSDPAPVCPSPEDQTCTDDGDCSGGARCRRMRADDPMGRCQLRPCVSEFDPRATQLDDRARVTPELVVPEAITGFAGATVAGDVAVAIGRTREDGTVELALAWEETNGVAVALATLDPASGAITEGGVQRFASAAPDQIAITHVSAGLVRENAEIEGEEVDASSLGGFVATWRSGASGEGDTRAVRIADLDGSAVAPGAIVVATESAQPRAFVGSGARASVLAHQGASFVVVPAVCGQRAR
ncbi:DNA polymerase III alpha subunit [Sandaracinus amylolyticus]|uniref:DNA polymerase III alpha subunit n=2 Tax=Sandaracinus amylolyticus TaxID=927083 RepID=A0A0F6YH17_9BACT|nr:DNA polymerase III alpha subunit [Sandaracinus amylolyticus]